MIPSNALVTDDDIGALGRRRWRRSLTSLDTRLDELILYPHAVSETRELHTTAWTAAAETA